MSKAYIISYDLSNPGRNYEALIKKIKSYSRWAKLGGSAYVIITDKSATEIRDSLKIELDTNDKIFVGVLGKEAAWVNLGDNVSDWLRKNL